MNKKLRPLVQIKSKEFSIYIPEYLYRKLSEIEIKEGSQLILHFSRSYNNTTDPVEWVDVNNLTNYRPSGHDIYYNPQEVVLQASAGSLRLGGELHLYFDIVKSK